MKSVLLFVLLGYVSACCSSWLRDAQTAKNLAFLGGAEDENIEQEIFLVQPSSAINVKDIQVDMTFVLSRNLASISTFNECACECTYCRYYINAVLVVNLGQGILLWNLNPPGFAQQYFAVSLPRNDSNVLYGIMDSLNCFDQKVDLVYNSANDPFFVAKYPDGIQLNAGDSIEIVWQFIPQVENCDNMDGGISISATGVTNYYLSYGECPQGSYKECVAEILENEKFQERKIKH